jgi:hypothetical protein
MPTVCYRFFGAIFEYKAENGQEKNRRAEGKMKKYKIQGEYVIGGASLNTASDAASRRATLEESARQAREVVQRHSRHESSAVLRLHVLRRVGRGDRWV